MALMNKDVAVLQDKAHDLFDKAQSFYSQAKWCYKQAFEALQEVDKLAGLKLNKVDLSQDAFLNSTVGEIPKRSAPVLKKTTPQEVPVLKKTAPPVLKKAAAAPILLKKTIKTL